mmetsp:Transcript_17365/g.20444  ORF Transcript_17365/g.20444 Transcript_17365/m.20444 type:complete len:80 (+) Transcript_17365:1027-1266(+)
MFIVMFPHRLLFVITDSSSFNAPLESADFELSKDCPAILGVDRLLLQLELEGKLFIDADLDDFGTIRNEPSSRLTPSGT